MRSFFGSYKVVSLASKLLRWKRRTCVKLFVAFTDAAVKIMTAGTVNAQALACSTTQAIAASDARHAAVFARAGAIPWLVGLVSQWPSHACGRNAASALREILQDSSYQVSISQMLKERHI